MDEDWSNGDMAQLLRRTARRLHSRVFRLPSGSDLPLIFAMNSWKFAQSLMKFVSAGELGLLDAMS
jgi:hypothetical protein